MHEHPDPKIQMSMFITQIPVPVGNQSLLLSQSAYFTKPLIYLTLSKYSPTTQFQNFWKVIINFILNPGFTGTMRYNGRMLGSWCRSTIISILCIGTYCRSATKYTHPTRNCGYCTSTYTWPESWLLTSAHWRLSTNTLLRDSCDLQWYTRIINGDMQS